MKISINRCMKGAAVSALSLGMLAVPAQAQDQAQAPASERPAACKAFDFILGHWKLVDWKTGESPGSPTATFERGINDCSMKETFFIEGKPYFDVLYAYSTETATWSIYGVGVTRGLIMRYEDGVFHGNEIRFDHVEPHTNGRFSYFNLPDGTIRERMESTKDGGITWKTEFDMKWTRIKP
ncbi:MAG: hypothetical protein NAOJABEB_00023 [Steroidobacteraceae bacterium]|nr:hypothetical protein [Steroidobacteraceae bacterium]